MKSFSIENIKSFKNETEIDIRPLTIFVGKNSCGKSSLIRFPVVLAQTGDDFISPLQLYGKMIDYGTYSDIVFDHTGGDISYSIKYDFAINVYGEKSLRYSEYIEKDTLDVKNMEIRTRLGIIRDQLTIKNQKLFFDGECVYEYFASENGSAYRVYGAYDRKYKRFDKVNYEISGVEGILYDIIMLSPSDSQAREKIKDLYFHNDNFVYDNAQRARTIKDLLYKETDNEKVLEIRKIIKENTDFSGISPDIIPIALASMNTDVPHIKDVQSDDEYALKFFESDFIKQYKDDGYTFEEIKFWYICECFSYFSDLIFEMHSLIRKERLYFSYIGPFRQEPERIYRYSGTQPNRVGVKGEYIDNVLIYASNNNNMPIIDQISAWLSKTMGYKLVISNIADGYYQLLLEDKNGIRSNISDVGYGISQILPIVTQVMFNKPHKEREFYDSSVTEMTVIEQPELHLHPAAQAELAELFATCVIENKSRRLLIETHSEHFIRKLQVLVADKNCKISADDVAIYYVDKNDKGEAYVDKLNLLPNGQFEKEWPTGFFDKALELSMDLIKKNSEA